MPSKKDIKDAVIISTLFIFGVYLLIAVVKYFDSEETLQLEMGCEYYKNVEVRFLPAECLKYFTNK